MTATAARARLDRRQVLEAALSLVDRDGLEVLTMRRLGTELGVDPMTIHHHVESKDKLLDGITELLWEKVDRPNGSSDPAGVLRLFAGSIRGLFHSHPEAAPLLMRCSVLTLAELELWRAYLDALAAAGIEEPAALLRPVLLYALGTGNAEVSMLGVEAVRGERRAVTEREVLLYLGQALPAGTSPALAEAAVAMIADCNSDRCFEDGLEMMLGGVAAA
jgi:TetR/AcrR family tetracycline transcriptional repressor